MWSGNVPFTGCEVGETCMKRVVSAKAAANALLCGLCALAVFHVLMILRVLPVSIVWGGSAAGPSVNLVRLEITALIVTLLFGLIVAAKMRCDWLLKEHRETLGKRV